MKTEERKDLWSLEEEILGILNELSACEDEQVRNYINNLFESVTMQRDYENLLNEFSTDPNFKNKGISAFPDFIKAKCLS